MPLFQSASAPTFISKWRQQMTPPEIPSYLSIETEIGALGYRYHAKDLRNEWKCTSQWQRQYSEHLLERCLFVLACKMADFNRPAFSLDLSSDTIVDFNYKLKTKLKIARSPLPASVVWADEQAYQDYKEVLLAFQQHQHKANLKTTEEEVLSLYLESQVYRCPELGSSIALVALSEVRE